MKNQGHTKTLFIQGGKYKWSYKYENCRECKTCEAKHKGKGLCTRCFDKQRIKTSKKRQINLKKQQIVHYYKKRILFF